MTGVLEEEERKTHREHSHAEAEAESRETLPQAEERLGLPEAGRGKEGSSIEA